MIVQTAAVVSRPSKMNAAGWFVIALMIVAFIIGGSVLGAGISKANTCDGMIRYEAGSYYLETQEYRDCVNQAASLILGGIICLIIGGVLSCVSCCACGGVGCFRDYENVVVNSPVMMAAGTVPMQQYHPQQMQMGQNQPYSPSGQQPYGSQQHPQHGQHQPQWGQPQQQWGQQQQWQAPPQAQNYYPSSTNEGQHPPQQPVPAVTMPQAQ